MLMESYEVLSHLTEVSASLMVSLVVRPPAGHGLLVGLAGGGHPHVVCLPTLPGLHTKW